MHRRDELFPVCRISSIPCPSQMVLAPAIGDPHLMRDASMAGEHAKSAVCRRVPGNDLSRPQKAAGLADIPAGGRAGGSSQSLTHAIPRGQQKVSRKTSLSGFAAWLDCGRTHERRHGPPGSRRWPFGLERGFTVSRLQTDASSMTAPERWILHAISSVDNLPELWTISRFGVPRWLGVVCGQAVEADPCRRRTTGRNRLRRIGAKSPSASSTRCARHTQRNTLRWSSRAIRFQRLPMKLSLARSP